MEYNGKYAIFIYQESDENLIKEVSLYLDNHAENIFDFFGVKCREKVIINMISTKSEFDKKFILDHPWANESYKVPGWAIGYYKDGNITYLSLNDYKSTTHAYKDVNYKNAITYYKKTIVHEFVHYVNDLFIKENNCSPTEKYLREGIATYLSKQKENIDIEFTYSLEALLEKDMNKSCYDGWYIVTKYLVENYSKDKVMDLFKSNRQAREFLENEMYDRIKMKYGGTYERRD